MYSVISPAVLDTLAMGRHYRALQTAVSDPF